MFDLWRRLTGGTEQKPTASPAVATPAIAEAAPVAIGPQTPTTPAVPAAADGPPVATEVTLHRSLLWRCKVLLDGASRDALASDGPHLVELLKKANESVIRQPPEAAARALNLARNPNTPLPRIVDLFENDPMLAQSLLRQANSVYYRRDGAPCTSLTAAVQRIGLTGVLSILMATMVQQMLCRPGGAYDSQVQKVWSHMQRTAPIARALSPAFQVDADAAYSFALLHDVGKLLVFDHISTLRHDRRREVKMPETFFRQLIWHLHEPLGGLAALRWDMGGEAAHAISEHHRRPVPEKPDRMTECLHVSETVELAHTNFTKLDWESIWSNGGITSDMVTVQDRLRRMED
jgi:HD-like signal output (HDOD) protein